MTARATASAPCAIPPSLCAHSSERAQGAFPFDPRAASPATLPLRAGPRAEVDPPPYGSLSPQDEYRLYLEDYPRWADYVAPRWVQLLSTSEGLVLNAPMLLQKPALKRAVWRVAPADLRQRLTDHLAGATEPADA